MRCPDPHASPVRRRRTLGSGAGHPSARASRRGAVAALLLATATPFTACDFLDEVITVEAPDRVLEDAIGDPAQAPLLMRSVQGAFECAFSSTVVVLGLLGDELDEAGGNGFQIALDRRDLTGAEGGFGFYASNDCDNLGIYTPLSTARFFADDFAGMLEGWSEQQVAQRDSMLAATLAYSGYSRLLLGEAFCTAAIDAGPELSRDEIVRSAVDRFTAALAHAQAAGIPELSAWIRVGRARALLGLGETAAAVQDAEAVPAGFVKAASRAGGQGSLRENYPFVRINRNAQASVAAPFRGLAVGGVPDPRVTVVDMGRVGSDGVTAWWTQRKFVSESDPIPLATWDEAQLIIAEVVGGDRALAIINAFHDRAGLPAFVSADPAEIAAHVREERRRELFLESHRLNDLYRFEIPLEPAPGTPYRYGGVYGDLRCLPLPDRERFNNPNL